MNLRSPTETWIPSLREAAIKYHMMLDEIERLKYQVLLTEPLSQFEKLVLTLEDRSFLLHPGISIRGMTRELVRFLRGKRHGGASTIDMQLVRTITGRYERTISRKVFEIFGAIILQRHFSKLEILRVYLNIAYFGTDLNGSDKASLAIFGKSAIDLHGTEAAQLASLLVYPKPSIDSVNWRAKMLRRANYGLGMLTRVEKRFQ